MPPNPHNHWRDAQEFKRYGLHMSTPSNDVYKLLDAAVTQIVSRYEDPSLGGSALCLEKMLLADQDNIMARVIKTYQDGRRVYNDKTFTGSVQDLTSRAQHEAATDWERRHARAVTSLANGQVRSACTEWESLLDTYPQDILALHFLHETYIGAGDSQGIHDSCAKVVKHWNPVAPLYGEMLAMYAFGLEETNQFEPAKKTAIKALEVNPNNPWAYHAMAHVNEMTRSYAEGIKFMSNHEHIWSNTTQRCHNYWHWATHHCQLGQFEEAHQLLENNILPAMTDRKTMSNMTDVASMCFKLDAEGYDVCSCLETVHELAKDHVDDHTWTFTDVHAMLVFVSADKPTEAARLTDGMRKFAECGTGDITQVYSEVGLPLTDAITAFGSGHYHRAVHLLTEVDGLVHKIGGSNAQRDIFKWMRTKAMSRLKYEE